MTDNPNFNVNSDFGINVKPKKENSTEFQPNSQVESLRNNDGLTIMTMKDVCKYLSMSRKKIKYLIDNCGFPYFQVSKNHVYTFVKEKIDEYFLKNQGRLGK